MMNASMSMTPPFPANGTVTPFTPIMSTPTPSPVFSPHVEGGFVSLPVIAPTGGYYDPHIGPNHPEFVSPTATPHPLPTVVANEEGAGMAETPSPPVHIGPNIPEFIAPPATPHPLPTIMANNEGAGMAETPSPTPTPTPEAKVTPAGGVGYFDGPHFGPGYPYPPVWNGTTLTKKLKPTNPPVPDIGFPWPTARTTYPEWGRTMPTGPWTPRGPKKTKAPAPVVPTVFANGEVDLGLSPTPVQTVTVTMTSAPANGSYVSPSPTSHFAAPTTLIKKPRGPLF
ncbi:hypothetical protein FQN50_000410 [Emmonsiellopsis sp. PD_5]|nr:hypothetical protein FQN50_000410 [Emmonsiellopsis sp. PD_5]